jgi:uncharacterized protein
MNLRCTRSDKVLSLVLGNQWMLSLVVVVIASIMSFSLNSCGSGGENGNGDEVQLPDIPASANEIDKFRAQKDAYFKFDKSSPIPVDERASFGGLKYYKYNDDYLVIATFAPSEKPDTMQIPDTQGGIRKMIRVGNFSFTLSNSETVYTLSGFKGVDETSSSILIPFMDNTTGRTTYSAGRYIDVEPNGGEEYSIDFNMAYSPYCAYNDSYSCVRVPPQNVLNIDIPVGEKIYNSKQHDSGAKK